MAIRTERAADRAAIHRLVRTCFPSDDEAHLVDALREAGDLSLSLVATARGRIIGHVAFSPMAVTADGRRLAALALAPVATAARHRRHGTAAALIEAGIARARAGGVDLIFVLGDPAYYGRFGFDAALATPFASPYAGPHFMALALDKRWQAPQSGVARHAPAFG